MKTHPCSIGGVILVAVLATAFTASADLVIDWYTIDGGGAQDAGGPQLQLSGTVGQPDTDAGFTLTGPTFTVQGGFWPGVISDDVVLGDCNNDGTVTIDDYTDIASCLTGPGQPLQPDCECADLDGDMDSDLQDFAAFQREFSIP